MRNIIITGGELFNKGAMAMTFVAVSELKKRFPDHEIYVLSELDLQRKPEELEQYAFKFMGWYPLKFAKAQRNVFLHIFCSLRNRREYEECRRLYANCDLMVDISGYALGTPFSEATCNRYLDHLEFARAYDIPMYLLPQSFGPFTFNNKELKERCVDNLTWPRRIYVRERDGYDALLKLGIKNVCMSKDLVLCNKEVELCKIFKKSPDLVMPEIDENSVAILPNGMTKRVKNDTFILEMYSSIIQKLVAMGKKVYILKHSTQDDELCKEIKKYFPHEQAVVLLEGDFSCIEYNEIVKQFHYIIASRYHSIIHAYKNAIPSIALGWAEKYATLLDLFQQSAYAFDLRENIEIQDILSAIVQMDGRFLDERKIISAKLKEIQKINIFDDLEL